MCSKFNSNSVSIFLGGFAVFKLVGKVAGDDAMVKAIFDYVRNWGIVAAVIGAIIWKYRRLDGSSLAWQIVDWIAIAVLVAGAVFLYAVNLTHGIRKLYERGQPALLTEAYVVYFLPMAVGLSLLSLVPGLDRTQESALVRDASINAEPNSRQSMANPSVADGASKPRIAGSSPARVTKE
jgi:hypothetical protein